MLGPRTYGILAQSQGTPPGGDPPSAPTFLLAQAVSSTRIDLEWTDNSNNETGFKIYRDAVLIDTVAANVTSYEDTGLTPSTLYQYYVVATNAEGDSDPSNTASATTSVLPSPDSIANLRLWLDGADPTTLFTDTAGTTPVASNADVVRRWNDKSANSYNFTNAGSIATYRTNVQNGHSIVRSGGSGGMAASSNVPWGARSTLFMVVTPPASNTRFILAANGTGPKPRIDGNTGGIALSWFNELSSNVQRTVITLVASGSGFFLFAVRQVDHAFIDAFVGGERVYRHRDSSPIGTTALEQIFGASGAYANADYAEVLLYDRDLTFSELNQVGEYLANKWGMDWEPYSEAPLETPAFSPTSIANLELWLDAADGATVLYDTADPAEDGERVRFWLDKSGNNFHGDTGSAGVGPIYRKNVIGGELPTVAFGGFTGLSFASGARATFASSQTVFVVMTETHGNDRYVWQGSGTSSSLALISGYSSGAYEWLTATSSPNRQSFAAKGSREWLDIVVGQQVDGNYLRGYLNGGSVLFDVTPTVANNNKTILNLGGLQQVWGNICEVIIYRADLTSSQVNQVGQYLAQKWGLSWTNVGPMPTAVAYPTLSSPTVLFDGSADGIIYHTFQPVHETEIQEVNKDGYTYWAYTHRENSGSLGPPWAIHLARSNDLESGWVDYGKVFDGRWPSVYYDSGADTFHMVYRQNTDAYVLRRATSTDGINWTDGGILWSGVNNPFLWKNPNDGLWYLFGHARSPHRIQYRAAATIAGLASASTITVISQSDVIASPSIMFHDDKYWLACETFPGGVWNTVAFSADSIDGPYAPCSNSPILTNDDACAMQHLLGDMLYLYYAEKTNDGYWDIVLRTVDLS